MGPELMLGAALLSAGGTAVKAISDSEAMKAQAASDQSRAIANQQWTERRTLEERASAQSQAGEEMRRAKLAQSKLGAVAGASGSGASDPTVMKLWGDIDAEGRQNAAMASVAGEQKAAGMTYQAALDRWGADSNAAIKRSAAKSTLIGGMMSAGGQMLTPMAQRYGGGGASSGGGTGYGGSSYNANAWKHTSTRYS